MFIFLSVLLQNSEEKKGVFDRINSFFNSKRKKSGSRHQSDVGSQYQEDNGLKSPTLPKDTLYDARKGAECGDNVSQSSTPSTISMVSVVAGDTGLPFADSNSSSSVREVVVCKISTGELNSGNVTSSMFEQEPTNLPNADSSSALGFTDSVVEEVSKRLHVHLDERIVKDTEEHRRDKTVEQTTLTTFKSTKTPEVPKSPNVTCISLASKKSAVKIGENGHSTTLSGKLLESESSTSHVITIRRADDTVLTDNTEDDERNEMSSSSIVEEGTPSHKENEAPRSESPVLHKAIWVETHLGEEEGWGREGETEGIIKESEEGLRADSPPVFAVPVTVIPEDESVTQIAADRPVTPCEIVPLGGGLPEPAVSLVATAEEFQTASPELEKTSTGKDSKQKSIKDKTSRDVRVTRKTVSLPSKFFAHKVNISPEVSSDENKATEEERNAESCSKAVDTTEAKL